MILPAATVVSLRVGDAFDNAGMSLKAAYAGTPAHDIAIERLLATLLKIPLRLL